MDDFVGDSIGLEEDPMSFDKVQESVDYKIPQVTTLPDEYRLVNNYYDEEFDMVMLTYEKDWENGFSLSINSSAEDYGEVPIDEITETVSINGTEGIVSDMDGFIIFTWEQNGKFLELMEGD